MDVRKIFKYFIIFCLLLNIAVLMIKYGLFNIAASLTGVILMILLQL